MKVLLTGASGFVGSHVLDSLRTRGIPTAILLRPTSDRQFIQPHLATVELHNGSIGNVESLKSAMPGITHVIHCAGLTRARTSSEFSEVNQIGTRNVITAINAQAGVKRLVHISSLAAIGPAGRDQPAREDDTPHPVSHYGKSKLAGETEVRQHCRTEFVLLRPPAVYGPRDNAFLSLFQAVKRHLLPRPSATQALSLVFVKDLADAIVACLDHPAAGGKAYFVSGREVATARDLADEIAAQFNHWTVPVPLPPVLLWPVCLFRELWSHLTRRASLLNLQKFAELRAPGWVCDPSRLEREVGFTCNTKLKEGVARTLLWYREQRWL